MPDEIFIQDRFTIIDPDTGVSFSDALVLPQSEYDALTDVQIAALKQDRFTAWKALAAVPTEVEDVSSDDQLQDVDQQIDTLSDQLDTLVELQDSLQTEVSQQAEV